MEDGWVVGDLWTSPAHHQSAAIHMLHLHVDGSTAANWKEDGGRDERREKEGLIGKWKKKEQGDRRRQEISRNKGAVGHMGKK